MSLATHVTIFPPAADGVTDGVPEPATDGAVQRAVAAFARAVRLSCLAARRDATPA